MTQPIAAKPLMLVFPFGYLSHYLRCLQLAQHFSSHYQVLFAAHPLFDRYVEAAGFSCFSCASIDAQKVLEQVRHFDFSWLGEEALEPVFLAQVSAINQWNPAVVLGDATPTLRMAADATGVPMISLLNGYMSKYYAAGRTLSRTHPLYKYLQYLPEKILNLATIKGEAIAFTQVHKPFRVLRKKYGIKPRPAYLDESEGDLTLICDSTYIFPQLQLPASYKIIGPLFHDSAAELRDVQLANTTKKTIMVSMGSTGDWEKLRFLNDNSFGQYRIIAAGDSHRILNNDAIIHLPFVHAKDLFPQVDLLICHGGNGSIYQALAYGIPVLCKTNHFEQEWNVAAFSKTGVAKSIDGITSLQQIADIIAANIHRKNDALLAACSRDIKQHQSLLEENIASVIRNLEADTTLL